MSAGGCQEDATLRKNYIVLYFIELTLILEKPTDFPFLNLNTPTIPLYYNRPWFLPIAGAWYRLKDFLAR